MSEHTYAFYKVDENGKIADDDHSGFSPAFSQFGQQCLNALVNGTARWRKYGDTKPTPAISNHNHIGLSSEPKEPYEVTRRRKPALEDR